MENAYIKVVAVESYNCLLDEVFVPDMTDRQQKKTVQQRLREEEPDVFDRDVSFDQYLDWIRG